MNEIIKEIEMLKAEIEWDHSIAYQATLDTAIAALEMQEKLKERIAGLVAKRKVNPWEEMFIGEVVKILEEFVVEE